MDRGLPMLTRLSCKVFPGLVLAAVLWAARAPVAQQLPTPPVPPGSVATFKTEINYVEVSARVVDTQGNFVRDLQKKDFQVLEDKRSQTIAAFDLVDIPVARLERPRFAANSIEPDAVTNAGGFDGRIYVLVLDALHTDPLRGQRVRAAAKKFIEENLGANDLAAVAVVARGTPAAQELTTNRRLLLAAVDKFVGQQPQSTAVQQAAEINNQVVSGVVDPGNDLLAPDEKERLSNAKRALEVLTQLSDWMSGVRGRRKAIIYVSEGLDYDLTAAYNNLDHSPTSNKANIADTLLGETNDVIAAATQNNVSIYGVDPRGLASTGADTIELADLPVTAPVDTSLGTGDPSGLSAQANSTAFRPDYGLTSVEDELRNAQDSLRTLSDETGGFAVVNSNDFTTAFNRIVEDNSSYYLLGYYSANEKHDGKFRTIDVRVSGRPGLIVRARNGYVAPSGKPSKAVPPATGATMLSSQLGDLLASLVPVAGGVTFSATASAFSAAPQKNVVIVTLEVNGKDLKLTEQNGRFTGKLDALLVAFDRNGKPQATKRSTVDLGLKPESHDRLTEQSGSFRYVSQLELPPGTYRLEAAVVDSTTRKGGSVHYDLEVPDFAKAPLSMSNLVLASATASFWPTIADKGLGVTLPVAPTALREFTQDDGVAVFAQIYDNKRTPANKLDITTTVRTDDGRALLNSHEEHSAEDVQSPRVGFDYSTRFGLKGLSPGLYVLTVEVKSRLGNSDPIRRMVQFRIR